jgi:hypothetical protein
MTTKEKVIRESIAMVEKELAELDYLMNTHPALEVAKLQAKAQELIKLYPETYKSKEFSEKWEILAKEDRKQRKIQKDIDKKMEGRKFIELVERKSELSFELRNLNTELYFETKK